MEIRIEPAGGRLSALSPPAQCLLLALVLGGCEGGDSSVDSNSLAEQPGEPWFEEVARQSGLDFEHVRAPETRFWFPEIMGAGVAFLDYDGDGDQDLYCVQGGDLARSEGNVGNRLYQNDGSGGFTDATERSGTGDKGYGMGCATGDFDADGDVDLYVTNVGANVLYRNEGNGSFVDITESAGVGDESWGTSCAFLDYDLDGDLDLFVANYISWNPENEPECFTSYGERDFCHPNNFNAPARDVLFRNDGGSGFVDATSASGIAGTFGNGLGVTTGDFDQNGYTDIYVANDLLPNQLWMNQGDGRFLDRALLAGCAVNMQGSAEAGMGVASADVDYDGDLDLFMTHLRDETNTLYENEKGFFTDRTAVSGLGGPSTRFTGFGMGFADFDLDGNLDVYVANGRVGIWRPAFDEADDYAEPDQLFQGAGSGHFDEVSPRGGTSRPYYENSRGVAFADVDGDGDIDVAVGDNHSRVRLLRNVVSKGRHWALLRIVDERGVQAFGANVRLRAGGRDQWRSIQSAYSYCSASDSRAHFGLGEAGSLEEVLVVWPDGTRETFGPLAADSVHELKRGEGR